MTTNHFKLTTLIIVFCLVVGCKAGNVQPNVLKTLTNETILDETPLFLIEKEVSYQGEIDRNAEDSSKSVMYVGDAGVAGLIAQLAIQGGIASSQQKKKLERKTEQANLILNQFKDQIDAVTPSHLKDIVQTRYDSIDYSTERSDTAEYAAHYELSTDVLASQDMEALIVKVSANSSNQIHVASNIIELDSTNDNAFRNAVEHGFIKSVGLLINDIHNGMEDDKPFKTHKYLFGQGKRYERAQLIKSDCEGKLIRNLKKELILIPHREPVENCEVI